jgi:ABC-type phosphate/phosphonate transport system substrate-binding protein
LLSLQESTEGQEVLNNFGALKFVETTDNDYSALHKMIKELGIDLYNYPD